MKTNTRKILHENFHSATGIQRRLVKSSNFTYIYIIEILKKYIRPNTKVLDIGCGAGTIDFFIASLGVKVLGVDLSKKAVQSCIESSKVLNLNMATRFKVMDFPKEKPSEKFDYVLLFEVLEHLEDDLECLKRIQSLLKKGGILVLSTPSNEAPLHRLGLLKEFDRRVGHLRRYSVQELLSLLNTVGLDIIEIKPTEGILRNFLFTNNTAGNFIRVINKLNLSYSITTIDNFLLKIFGASDIFIIAQKK